LTRFVTPEGVRLLAAGSIATLVACASGPRDVVPDGSRDVRVTDAGGVAPDAYVYVARREHGVVALAEARNMTNEDARIIVDRIADELETCARRLEQERTLVDGAARIIAIAQPSGPPGMNVRLAPGGPVAQNALLCLVAPVRAISFPPSKSGAPGIAIEATWGPAGAVPHTGNPSQPKNQPVTAPDGGDL
jgi:hypothetical protein